MPDRITSEVSDRTAVSSPLFSVLISICDTTNPAFLKSSLISVARDQIILPTEIVVVIDGIITKEVDEVIQNIQHEYAGSVILVRLSEKGGLANALNAGLQRCSCELVARMDDDDISLPERFLLQTRYMIENKHIAAASSQILEYDDTMSKALSIRSVPSSSSGIEKFATRRSPLNHPATIFRASIIRAVGGYPVLPTAQDYGLWSLLLKRGYKLGNLNEVLVHMRTGESFYNRRGFRYFRGEFALLQYQHRIGFISFLDYLLNISIRFISRIVPVGLRSISYSIVRWIGPGTKDG